LSTTNCPFCGEIVRSDLLTCWSCGKKFSLSETFTGVSKQDEPPVDAWRDTLQNRTYSQESLNEVRKEFASRRRKSQRIRFFRRIPSTNFLGKSVTFMAIVASITSIVVFASQSDLALYKNVPLKRMLQYTLSEYYRYGYDSVANIDSFIRGTQNEMNQTLEGFNEWVDEGEKIEGFEAPKSEFDESACLELMKLRGMLIVLNNVGSNSPLPTMKNTPGNRANFIRGCVDASKD
jgi:hypothetical protein